MAIGIFHFEGPDGGFERELELLDDKTLLYTESPNYYAYKGGAKFESETLSVTEAKARWPSSAADIDAAVKRLRHEKASN